MSTTGSTPGPKRGHGARKKPGPGAQPAAAQVAPEKPAPDKVEVSAEGDLRAAEDPQKVQLKEGRPYAQQTANDFVESLFDVSKEELFLTTLGIIIQFCLLRLGITDTLAMLPHTNNAATLLLPAVEAILNHQDRLRTDAKLSLDGIDTGAMSDRKQRLVFIRKLIGALKPLNYGLEALETHLEQALDGDARLVMSRVESLMGATFGLTDKLQPLTDLKSKSALAGVEQKKAFAQVATQAEQQTLERVDEALKKGAAGTTAGGTGTPAGGTTGPATPGGLPADLKPAPVKGRRGRGRSKTFR